MCSENKKKRHLCFVVVIVIVTRHICFSIGLVKMSPSIKDNVM